MGEVEVEGLIEREGGGIIVQSNVILGCGAGDGVVCKSCEDLLDVAYAYGAPGGGLEVVISGEVEIDAVFEVLPFLVGEEGAEGGVAEGDGFVGAEGLCTVG